MVSTKGLTEIEKPFLVAKGFNTNLVQFLLTYHVIISNVHMCYFMYMISHVHGHAPKTVLWAQKIVTYDGLEKSHAILSSYTFFYKNSFARTKALILAKKLRAS